MCKTCRDYPESTVTSTYMHISFLVQFLPLSKSFSLCAHIRFRAQGYGWNHSPSTGNFCLQWALPALLPELRSESKKFKLHQFLSKHFSPPVETNHHFKAPRQSGRFTLVTILQGCQSGNLIEKHQHQVKQDIPERAPLSHITVTGSSHDLQDATSVPTKETWAASLPLRCSFICQQKVAQLLAWANLHRNYQWYSANS